MPASIWLAFVCCTKTKEKTKKVRNPGLAESKDQSLMRPKGPQARPCHCSWRVFLTSGVSSLCGELNQNNPGHLICRTRIPREKRRGPGRKERKAFPESTGSPRKLAFASYVSFLTLLSKEYAARFCDRYIDGKVVFGDLARSGDPMEYRRTKGWPPWCRRRLAVTHWIYKWSVVSSPAPSISKRPLLETGETTSTKRAYGEPGGHRLNTIFVGRSAKLWYW